jgi:hypothetical protein
VHAVGDVHDTPRSSLSREGLGVWTIRHRDPSHASASVLSRNAGDGRAPAPRLQSPTAMQNLAEVQQTPLRLRFCGAGLGTSSGSARQVRPSQRAATGRRPYRGGPTAWQKPGAAQDTLLIGPAEAMTVQRVPVHASAGAPTATHTVADAQETPSRRLS